MDITITTRAGRREAFDADRINRSIERACAGLDDDVGMVTQIATDTQVTLYDGITEDELDAVKTQQIRLENKVNVPVSEPPTFTLPVIVLFILVGLIFGYVMFLTFRHQKVADHVTTMKQQMKPKTKEGKLDAYVSGCLRSGMNKEQIKTFLEQHGWDKTSVDNAFSKYR